MNDRDLPRAQAVYASLKDMIRDGSVRPGQRMREIEIAEAQGVSRTPVREAMHRLVSEGLLEATPARGIAVTELSKQQVLELYGLREFLEGASARFAAQHASLPEMRALHELLEHVHTVPDEDHARHALLNKRFHALIAEAAHNTYLSRALQQLSDSLMLVPGTTFQAKGRVSAVHAEHLAIIAAIDARDADGAEAAARDHIRRAGEVRLQMLFGQR
jgi:DNA-binding GntR family transcriptional regulator